MHGVHPDYDTQDLAHHATTMEMYALAPQPQSHGPGRSVAPASAQDPARALPRPTLHPPSCLSAKRAPASWPQLPQLAWGWLLAPSAGPHRGRSQRSQWDPHCVSGDLPTGHGRRGCGDFGNVENIDPRKSRKRTSCQHICNTEALRCQLEMFPKLHRSASSLEVHNQSCRSWGETEFNGSGNRCIATIPRPRKSKHQNKDDLGGSR